MRTVTLLITLLSLSFTQDYSLEFDGVDDYVDIGRPISLEGGQNGAVSAWFKTNTDQDNAIIITNDTQPTNPDFSIVMDYGGIIRINGGPPSVSGPNVITTQSYNDGGWHHVVGIKYGDNCVKMFIDTELIGNHCSGSGNMDNGENFFIGCMRSDGSNAFEGLIDKVYIYDRDLDEAEVIDLFNYNSPNDGLVGHWNFNEQVNDLSGYGNHGVIYGNPTYSEDVPPYPHIYGCTDTYADNYNPVANWDDGSCDYVNLSSGLVAYYPFNGNVNDLSENNLDGVENLTVDYVEGINNQAIKFNGINNIGFVVVENSSPLTFDEELSMSLWIRIDDSFGHSGQNCNWNGTDGAVQKIIAKSNDRNGFSLAARILESGEIKYDIKFAENGSLASIAGTDYISMVGLGEWANLTITLNQEGSKIYLNGNLLSSDTRPANFDAANDETMYFGIQGGEDSCFDYWYPLNGAIDELFFFNRTLNDLEILELFNAGIVNKIYGCTDSDACNYNAEATDDDGSCTFPNPNYDCYDNCTAVMDCAGECGGNNDYCADGGDIYEVTIPHDSNHSTMDVTVELNGTLPDYTDDYTCEWSVLGTNNRTNQGCELSLTLMGDESNIVEYQYILNITTDDGSIVNPDIVTVRIHPEPNSPPVIQLTW